MILKSKMPPPFLPKLGQATILEMGLGQLAPSEWMLVDEDATVFLSHKLEQQRKHPDQIYQTLPASKDAQSEFSSLLEAHLIADHKFQRTDTDKLINPQFGLEWKGSERDLWSASLWVQEDICLLEEIKEEYILSAASICSPSNWDMPSKIGKPVSEIHNPVPGYKNQMSNKVDRLMRNLKPGKPLKRFNWSIQPHGDLYWKTDVDIKKETLQKHWRVERQTLLRLPSTNAIVFGIRVFLHSFTAMAKIRGFDNAIAAIIERLPREQSIYKNLL